MPPGRNSSSRNRENYAAQQADQHEDNSWNRQLQRDDIDRMIAYVSDKLAWIEEGRGRLRASITMRNRAEARETGRYPVKEAGRTAGHIPG